MRGKKHRFLAMALALSLVLGMTPTVTAAEQSSGGLCEHHTEHTAECGYTEGTPGTPCGHEHTDECYTLVTECVHEHTEDCYPAEDVSGNTATPSDADGAEPICGHICSEESGCITKALDCQHEHKVNGGEADREGGLGRDEACGYVPAIQGTPCGYVCAICNPQNSGPTSGQSVQKSEDELATPSDATALSVEDVQKLIDALPTAEALAAMTQEEQGAVYTDLQAAYDAYEALSDGEKLDVTGAEIFEALFAVFNEMTNVLADSAFNITSGTANTDYTYSNGVLTVKNGANLTISMADGATTPTSDRIVVESGATASITLNGVNITGAGTSDASNTTYSAITLSPNASLTLKQAQGSSNTLAGGSGGDTVAGAPAIRVPEGTTLTVLCANQSGNDHICSDDCGSLSATGGSSTSNFGGVGIGGGTVSSATPGAPPTSENCGTVLLLGGEHNSERRKW